MALRLADGLTLYFARHGETEANTTGRLQGQSLDTPLTAKGLAQARALGQILLKEASIPLDWVSSPLGRACATMEGAREVYGLPPHGYRTDARLMEINLGDWEGLTHAQAQALFPADYTARQEDKWSVRHASGRESYADVAARAESFVTGLARDTFAVTPGAFTRILRGLLSGLDWKGISALGEPQGCVFRVRDSVVERLDA